jgi:hypothetical protein
MNSTDDDSDGKREAEEETEAIEQEHEVDAAGDVKPVEESESEGQEQETEEESEVHESEEIEDRGTKYSEAKTHKEKRPNRPTPSGSPWAQPTSFPAGVPLPTLICPNDPMTRIRKA